MSTCYFTIFGNYDFGKKALINLLFITEKYNSFIAEKNIHGHYKRNNNKNIKTSEDKSVHAIKKEQYPREISVNCY